MLSNIFRGKQYAVSKRYSKQSLKDNIEEKKKSIKENYAEIQDQETECKPNVPEGIVAKCTKCGKIIYNKLLISNNKICPECGAYFKMTAIERLSTIIDVNDLCIEYDKQITTKDPLKFPGYKEKLLNLQKRTGLIDGILVVKAKIKTKDTYIAVMDPVFLMGSMGTAIGEKLTRLFERATKERLPVIVFCSSGGARMQEGIFSLMQMAKVSGALARHSEAGLLYIAVLTDPTTGGVTASFAMLGDIILAEPKALIGFAGPRVIQETIGQKLPEGFQRSEFLLEHGFIDKIVARNDMRDVLSKIILLHHNNMQGGSKDEVNTME